LAAKPTENIPCEKPKGIAFSSEIWYYVISMGVIIELNAGNGILNVDGIYARVLQFERETGLIYAAESG
jgi:hypothetical protein